MAKSAEGMVLVVTLVFTSLCAMMLSQISLRLVQNTKLVSGFKQQTHLLIAQHNFSASVEALLRREIHWQALIEIKEAQLDTGVEVSVTALPSCLEMVTSDWYQIKTERAEQGTAFIGVLPQKADMDVLMILLTSCTLGDGIGVRTNKVLEFAKGKSYVEKYSEILLLPSRLL